MSALPHGVCAARPAPAAPPRSAQPLPPPPPVPATQPAALASLGRTARVVRRCADRGCELEAAGEGVAGARIAAACLLQPEPGDLVLLWQAPDGTAYVLTVLERAADAGCVRLPGGAALHAGAGDVQLCARRVDLQATQQLRAGAPHAQLLALHARIEAGALQLRVERAFAWLGSLHARGRDWLSRFEHGVCELGDSLRRVRGLDESDVGQQRMRVRQRLHIRSRDTSIVSERRVRVDAQHIDLG